jgi:hypothetical protein
MWQSARPQAGGAGFIAVVAPVSCMASSGEVLFFIEKHALMGRGIGYVDVHLLAAARLAETCLWTRDKRLVVVADELGMSYAETRH